MKYKNKNIYLIYINLHVRMAFDVSNFIKSYLPTDKVIQIQNISGIKVYTFSICNYQKSLVDNNNLIVIFTDNNPQKQYNLNFSDHSQALLAQLQLKNAVNNLKLNCENTQLSPPSPSQTPIPITYLQYKNLQQTNTLFVCQWYDVTDTTNLLQLGGVTIRLLAKAVDDYEPSGIVLSLNQLVTINSLDDTIQRFEVANKKILAINKSKITYDTTSFLITASTASNVTVVNSNNIEVNNASTASLENCTYLTIGNNSNIILKNATNCIINNIQQDLSTLPWNLINVTIDQSDTLGYFGKHININPGSTTFLSYRDFTDQEVRLSTNNTTVIITLDNLITQANGEFKIKYTGTGIQNIVKIIDKNSNTLLELNDTMKNSWGVFRYNKTSSLFEFVRLDFTTNVTHLVYQTNVTTNTQTSFNLPSAATDASKLEMYINGQKQLFGLDFTYSSPGLVIFQNRFFFLNIGDEIEFLIY